MTETAIEGLGRSSAKITFGSAQRTIQMNASEEEREQDALEAAAEEKRLVDAAWIELVQSVLSHTRIDPKHEGKEFQPFSGV